MQHAIVLFRNRRACTPDCMHDDVYAYRADVINSVHIKREDQSSDKIGLYIGVDGGGYGCVFRAPKGDEDLVHQIQREVLAVMRDPSSIPEGQITDMVERAKSRLSNERKKL